MNRLLNLAPRILLVMMALALSGAAAGFQSSWEGVQFRTPQHFSRPEKLGLNAVSLHYPPAAAMGKESFEIALVLFSEEQRKSMGLDDAGMLNYAKTVFFATAEPAQKKVSRKFMGQEVVGERQTRTIPRQSTLEAYLIHLKAGRSLAIGFMRFNEMSEKDGEAIIAAVAASIEEVSSHD